MPVMENHTALDDRIALENKTKFSGETIKQIYWQMSINDQKPNLKIKMLCIEIMGLLDTDVTKIAPKSWHPNEPLWEVNDQLLGTGPLPQVKQSAKWVKCIGLEEHRGKLKPIVAKIAMNFWRCDLLQQQNTQTNILPVSETNQKQMYVSKEKY